MKKISAMYDISKDLLTKQDLDRVQRELTIESRENKLYFAEKKIIKLCYDKGDYISVPRAYGLSNFGAPLQSELAYGDPIEINFTKSLRDEQPRIIETVLRQRYPNGLISMPPGSGKTVIGIKLISELKVRALILVHKTFLLDQWKERILEFTDLKEDNIGRVQGPKCEFDKAISIGMIESIYKKEYPKEFYSAFGFIISDETHRIASEQWRLCLEKFPAISRVGLSATLTRSDGLERVFKVHLGEIIASAFGQKLIPKIFIRKYKAVLPGRYHFGDKTNMPGAITDLCALDSRNNILTKIIVQTIEKSRKILVLSDRLAHLDILSKKIKEIKPQATVGKYVGGMSYTERSESAKCQVIAATYGVAAEGLDIPELDCLLFSSPHGNLKQTIGRILRDLPCKKQPVVIDLADESDQLPELKQMSDNRRRFYIRNNYSVEEF